MARPSLGQLKWFALLFAAFFALTSVGQYLFVSWSARQTETGDFAAGVASIERAMALETTVDPAHYFKTYIDAADYMVVLDDGTFLDINMQPHRPMRDLVGPVQCPILTEAAFAAPQTVVYRGDKIAPETWTIRAKRIQGGIAIVGISALDEVSRVETKLDQGLTLLGDAVETVPTIDFDHMDITVHWAIIADQGNAPVSANGRLPLKTDAMSLGALRGRQREILDGDRIYVASYLPVHDAQRRPTGVAIQLKDVTRERAALRNQLWFDGAVALGSFALFLVFAGLYATRQEREKQMIRAAFQNYFSPQILDKILREPDRLKLGGERREVTILFSDIRSFTSLSETLNPQQLTRLLQEYFEEMTQAVAAEEGIVDKFIGDAIMAFWGAPIEQPDQADRAVRAALDMVGRLKGLQDKWRAEGLPVLDIGIGINLGIATVGNFGSSQRFDYTLIGDAVNAASRIESLTKDYKSQILISDTTKRQLTVAVATRDLGQVQVRGKEETIRLHQVTPAAAVRSATT